MSIRLSHYFLELECWMSKIQNKAHFHARDFEIVENLADMVVDNTFSNLGLNDNSPLDFQVRDEFIYHFTAVKHGIAPLRCTSKPEMPQLNTQAPFVSLFAVAMPYRI